jgi:DMSO/TMAO reductase YedYZ molybdopterin-dependent catalytic subunit
MKRLPLGVMVVSFTLMTALLVVSGCRPDIEVKNTTQTVEIREYEGSDLSSINEFRENSILGVQVVDIDSYTLDITGLFEEPKSYTYDEVIGDYTNYKKISTLYCVDGWDVTILWEGVLVRDLIEKSNPSPEATLVIFHACDGYTTSFPIEYIMENDIILASKINGITLPSAQGFPFILVAESKWGYKWIRWVTEIELSDVDYYRGYWESRGFSNTGDLDENFLNPYYDFYYYS